VTKKDYLKLTDFLNYDLMQNLIVNNFFFWGGEDCIFNIFNLITNVIRHIQEDRQKERIRKSEGTIAG